MWHHMAVSESQGKGEAQFPWRTQHFGDAGSMGKWPRAAVVRAEWSRAGWSLGDRLCVVDVRAREVPLPSPLESTRL